MRAGGRPYVAGTEPKPVFVPEPESSGGDASTGNVVQIPVSSDGQYGRAVRYVATLPSAVRMRSAVQKRGLVFLSGPAHARKPSPQTSSASAVQR